MLLCGVVVVVFVVLWCASASALMFLNTTLREVRRGKSHAPSGCFLVKPYKINNITNINYSPQIARLILLIERIEQTIFLFLKFSYVHSLFKSGWAVLKKNAKIVIFDVFSLVDPFSIDPTHRVFCACILRTNFWHEFLYYFFVRNFGVLWTDIMSFSYYWPWNELDVLKCVL